MGRGVLEGGLGEEITAPESREPAGDGQAAPEQELEELKRRSSALAQELEALQEQIQRLEQKDKA